MLLLAELDNKQVSTTVNNINLKKYSCVLSWLACTAPSVPIETVVFTFESAYFISTPVPQSY